VREGALRKLASALAEQSLEDHCVDLCGIDVQSVAVVTGDDEVIGCRPCRGSERLAQPRDVDLHRLGGSRRRLVAPEPVDQAIGGHDLARIHHEDREQRTLLVGAPNWIAR
jgi:hypothetical protein